MKETIQHHLTGMSLKIRDMGESSSPDTGELLDLILPLEADINEQGNDTAVLVTTAMREYLEQGKNRVNSNLEPILDGLTLLRAIQDTLAKGNEFPYPIDDVMEKLVPPAEISPLSEIFLISREMAHDDLRTMGKILNNLEALEASAKGEGEDTFLTVSKGIKDHITRLILNETEELAPLHEGLTLLRAVRESMDKGRAFPFPIDDVMEKLTSPGDSEESAGQAPGELDDLSALMGPEDAGPPAGTDTSNALTDQEVADLLGERELPNGPTERAVPDIPPEPGSRSASPPPEETLMQDIFQLFEEITPDDLQAMGKILNALETLVETARTEGYAVFLTVAGGVKNYIGNLILEEETDTAPLEEGLQLLRAVFQVEKKGKSFDFPIDEVMEKLGPVQGLAEDAAEPPPESREHHGTTQRLAAEKTTVPPPPRTPPETTSQTEAAKGADPPLSEEDIQILGDFVLESLENLESIELNLINLEQAPDDTDIINDIFRPFHTIKGVSGFLDLKKINRLSHSTENLLDSAREGNFVIDNEITDLILASVDKLKQLLQCVEDGIASGTSPMGEEVNIDGLINRIENAETSSRRLGEILVSGGDIHRDDLEEALEIQKTLPEKMVGEIIIDKNFTDAEKVESALMEQNRGKKVATKNVKVDTDKLDSLVDLTGELVIAQSMLRQNTSGLSAGDQTLFQNLNQLGQIVSSLQKIAMSMRMVPIKSTFQKMVRLVRDLARNSGKDVSLKMTGEETEIDRNVAEALYEPMVHMIRNSSDHGLELPEERKRGGKQAGGTIELRAYHKGGNIIIEIEDDGRGLDKDRIFAKAVENELIAPDAHLPDREIFELIMAPGFSTAQKITEVSGRGVGMDVVKQAIENLRGRLDIDSRAGKGSRFTITLPLTLAIIEGMLVRVGEERYVIPTMAIVESFRPKQEEYFTVEGKGEMVMVRGNLVPLIRFEEVYNTPGDAKTPWEGLVVVVENKGEQRGLLIDELLGKEEFVIKSLGESLKGVKGLAGGAILGDGRVGLILDISGLFDSVLAAG